MRSRKLTIDGVPVPGVVLQWGRDLAVTETVLEPSQAASVSQLLQWGRDLAVTETIRKAAWGDGVWRASMGP